MLRYYFDVQDDFVFTRDRDGETCVDREAVMERAAVLLSDIAADVPLVRGQKELKTAVRNETGNVVYIAALNFAGRWL
ncbi:DUF6894 family protein [Methylobacterium durans]|uniref:DUF6894 family protein n=1 Tax=Methylobacterium durans TaxID=2202825 RepID=UPI0013A5B8DC|nr:hypothetical protein [Methylobacterium durans]